MTEYAALPSFWAWHIHDFTLCELLTEPLENRRDYIRKHKPPGELALRLRLLHAVRGPLPAALVEARWAYEEAQRASDATRRAYNEALRAMGGAWRAFAEAQQAAIPALEALHQQECPDCPWDGTTIFPEREDT